ncbi:MAG: M23 family metallopeptidase [Acutalibacteraceae bacterium]|nr:M23 family metallopeptidase [Acutalibacteraceae bacterium]
MKKSFKKYPNIYIALTVCLFAIGIGASVGLIKMPDKTDNEEFERITVRWSEAETGQPMTEEANIGVSGIADERVYVAPTTQKIEENKPFSGSFALPMGTDIIKDYSNGEMVQSKTMGDWRVHNGVDFGGSAGNEVVAVNSGKVTKVYDDGFWGTVVEIDHGNGMTVRYCGMKEGSCLPEGTEVEKYGKIGTLGHIPVEISDEDHLHLEVLIDGEYADPLKALNKVGGNE